MNERPVTLVGTTPELPGRISLFGCPVDRLGFEETMTRISEAIATRRPLRHVVVNAAKLVSMRKNAALREAVASCDLINADGQAVVWAAKLLGTPLPERVAGIDLMVRLIEESAKRGWRVFLLGASEPVVAQVASRIKGEQGEETLAGYRNGYFPTTQDAEVAAAIRQSQADILFVAISSPRKEEFLHRWETEMGVPFIMGVGGSFDVYSGLVTRAPLWMQRIGMEWFFRLLQEPRRMWRRYLTTNTLFLWMLAQAVVRQRVKPR